MSDKITLINHLQDILPKDLIGDIYKYAISAHFQKWIQVDKIDWDEVSNGCCKEAVEILKKQPDKINWDELSIGYCKEAIELLKNRTSKK